MTFSKIHKKLLVQLYLRQITRCEYDILMNTLYGSNQKVSIK